MTVSLVVPGFVRTPNTVNSLNGAGVPFGELSEASLKGMEPDAFARRAVARLERGGPLVVVAGAFERFAISLHRHLPGVFYRVAARAEPEYVNEKRAGE